MPLKCLGAVLATLAAGCASAQVERLDLGPPAADAPKAAITTDGSGSIELSVLIYNVEGLPWPARRGRGPFLDRIGMELARMRAAGTAPDVVLLQEAFTRRGGRIGVAAGYPYIASGPSARDRRREDSAAIPRDFVRGRRFLRGERFPKMLNGGLYAFSKFPIVRVASEPFSKHACAGFDCLANKGALLVSIEIPGAPTPIDLFTTHMNAQRASRVDLDRTHAAHRFQTDENAKFLERRRNNDHPLIFGGDFNMRGASHRLEHFAYRKPYQIVRHYCTVVVSTCDVRMSWDGDEPWLDTQDLQGFDDGKRIGVRPVRAEALFDGPQTGGVLADHDGYLVTYRLEWRESVRHRAPPPARSPG